MPDPEGELRYVMDAVRTIRSALHDSVPLIGFAGSPWTLATYMVEGGGGHEFQWVKKLAYESPAVMDELLAKLATAVTLYLAAQARAGAQALMVFDTWGGVLAPERYQQLSLAPMAAIVQGLRREAPGTPVILFTKNGGHHLELMAETGADAVGIDWTQDLASARQRVGHRLALQGNLDPTVLLSNPEVIRSEVARVLKDFGPGEGHVFNLGHGILQTTPPEHAAAMIEAVRELSPAYHRPG